jgi:KUP system potassium uptake protein
VQKLGEYTVVIRRPPACETAAENASGSAISTEDGSINKNKNKFSALLIGTVGVVYGDIGTSPVYAFREAMLAAGATPEEISRPVVLGLLSLILWALTIVVTVKYIIILLRADNDGEGGTLALMALAHRAIGRRTRIVFMLGIIGAALFYADAIITPAISILAAVEGLKIVYPMMENFIIPIAIIIIIGIFVVQSQGTAAVAKWFGPITLGWFVAIGFGGLLHIFDDPGVFAALNPKYALYFMLNHGLIGLVALGAVFLAVTGAEALYADLGHFGKKPISIAWAFIVFPALALNYLGQGAMVLADPSRLENPFFLLFSEETLIPIIILATLANIIASQAVITGAFSLTRQAIQLGLLPNLKIHHTSADQEGQIYMPQVNYLLMIGVIFLVVLFDSSTKLASAYGIAVTGTMVVTACLAFIVVWRRWHWPLWAAVAVMAPLLVIDLVFLSANAFKILEGGYVPIIFAAGIMLCMWTWVRGTGYLTNKIRNSEISLISLMCKIQAKPPQRIPGIAIFLAANPNRAPTTLLHNLVHFNTLLEKNVILTIKYSNEPFISDKIRATTQHINENFSIIVLKFGYMEQINIPNALAFCDESKMLFMPSKITFFLSRRAFRPALMGKMPYWQGQFYRILINKNNDIIGLFHLPAGRVVEISKQISV